MYKNFYAISLGLTNGCVDTDNGATDINNYPCQFYYDYPSDCGHYDDGDFMSNTMCCACKGLTLQSGKLSSKTKLRQPLNNNTL